MEENMEPNENGSGRSTWRERERERAKKEIIDAAAELFARKGFEDTSMKDIAERADSAAAGIRIGIELEGDRQGIVNGALVRALAGIGMQLAPSLERNLLVKGKKRSLS